MIVLVKESAVERETVQLLMEHGHMRLMELLLTVITILEKFVVREDQDRLPYIYSLWMLWRETLSKWHLHMLY